MSNESTVASMSDAVVAASLSAVFLRSASAPGSITAHPSVRYIRSINGTGSTTVKVPILGFGGGTMTAVAEGTAASNAALSSDSAPIEVARYISQYSTGDMLSLVNPVFDAANLETWGQGFYDEYARTLLSMIANITDGFTASVTATSTLTLSDFNAAVGKLITASAPAPYLAVLHGKQWGELRSDINENAGGSVAFDPATPELLRVKGSGFQGTLNGVDIFVCEYVPSSGGDRKGAIMAADAIVWADGAPAANLPGQISLGGKVLLEQDRNASAGLTQLTGTAFIGVAMGLDSRGVTLNSDA